MSNISLIEKMLSKSTFQKKKIKEYLSKQDNYFFNEFEIFLDDYTKYLISNNLTLEYGVNAYLKMVKNMFKSHVSFMRTGKYPVSNALVAIDNVYNDKNEMLSYMVGLALSQYLWSTHYAMFNHLKSALIENKSDIKQYIEIGPGHGLFLKNAIDILNDNVNMTAIDISPISLDISKSIIKHFHPNKEIKFINEDMLNLDLDSQCDFIVMGEVIEHVENPKLLLYKIAKLLNKNGKAFLSTCVNCPAVDHVYHFETVDEIRILFNACGLKIESEKVLPVEDLHIDEIIKQKITINYSAIVTKA